MCNDRRDFLRLSAGFAGTALLSSATPVIGATDEAVAENNAGAFQQRELPESIRKLRRMTDGIVPISLDERRARIEKARRLMRENKIDALYIEPGSSMFYYTGMRWSTSERMFAAIIPARGEIAWVCPKFEEERVRFFLFDGIRKAAPGLQFVSATPVTAGGRMFKSPAEIALMQRANDITIAAYKATIDNARRGMTQDEFAGNCAAAFRALGVQGGIFCSFGKYTAFPHGR